MHVVPRPHHQLGAALSRSDLVLNSGAVGDLNSDSRNDGPVHHTEARGTCTAHRGSVSPYQDVLVIANPHCPNVDCHQHFPLVGSRGV